MGVIFTGSIGNFKTKLKNDRDGLYDTLLSESLKYFPQKDSIFFHFKVFNILSILAMDLSAYVASCRESLAFLFTYFAKKRGFLVVDGEVSKETRNLFPGMSAQDLLLQFAQSLDVLRNYQARLSANAGVVSEQLKPDFCAFEIEQKLHGGEIERPKKQFKHADAYEDFLTRHSDLTALAL